VASVGLADTHTNVRDMDGRNDVHEFFAEWTPGELTVLGHYAVSHIYESLNST
jgi:hypothetical protein